jgi:16S rRNA (adenine1518-N6/adenine1519-N6)-dimethyltransferase
MSDEITAREKLKRRMLELNHEAKKSMGQNFLIADHVIEKILSQAQIVAKGGLVEIGPGLGAITDGLRKIDPQLLAIEFDSGLAEYWRRQKLNVIEADALKVDWQQISKQALISNLPYQIAASLVVELSVSPSKINSMVLMFQKEVALRIKADCTSDDYGFLSVISQLFWDVKKVCEAGPGDFLPAPKIASRVLLFERKENLNIKDRIDFLRFVKSIFQNRRRQIKSILKGFMTETHVELSMNYFASQEKVPTLRTEELSPSEIQNFYLFYKGLPK